MRLMNADILAGNAARSDMVIGVGHIHLYFVKRSMNESIAGEGNLFRFAC